MRVTYVFLGCVEFEALRPQTSEQGGHHVRGMDMGMAICGQGGILVEMLML